MSPENPFQKKKPELPAPGAPPAPPAGLPPPPPKPGAAPPSGPPAGVAGRTAFGEQIKAEVGFPEEPYSDTGESSEAAPPGASPFPPPPGPPGAQAPPAGAAPWEAEEAPPAGAPPQPMESAPFEQEAAPEEPWADTGEESPLAAPGEEAPFPQPPPQGMQMGPTHDDVHQIANTVADGVRQEFNTKISSLAEDIDKLKEMEDNMSELTDTLSSVEKKYESLEGKAGKLPKGDEEAIQDIKSTVDNLNHVLMTALPALIKEIREIAKKG